MADERLTAVLATGKPKDTSRRFRLAAVDAKAADSVDLAFYTIRPEPGRRVLRRTLASTVRFVEVTQPAQLFGAKTGLH
jgi:hypothetical protein